MKLERQCCLAECYRPGLFPCRHTNGIIKKLEARGFSRTQAEGITEALKELDTGSLVTKTDLRIALSDQTITLIKWMTGVLLAQGAFIVALIQYYK